MSSSRTDVPTLSATPARLDWFQSVRTRLVAAFLAVALMFLAILGWLLHRQAGLSLEAAAGAYQEQLAEQVGSTLDRVLFERQGDVSAIARQAAATGLEPGVLTDLLNAQVQFYAPMYRLVAVADPRGKLVAVNTVDGQGAALDTRVLVGTDVAGQEWFRGAVANAASGAAVVEDLHEDALLSRLTGPGARAHALSFSTAVRAEGGKVLGVVTTRFSWAVATDVVRKAEERARRSGASSARVWLLDHESTVLAGGNPADALVRRLGDLAPLRRAHERGAVSHAFIPGLDGEDTEDLAAFAHEAGYGSFTGLGWTVMVTRSRAEVREDLDQLRVATLGVGLGAAALLTLLMLLLLRPMLRHVNAVSSSLDRLATAEADLTQRLPAAGEDEVGRLATHFNAFMDRLESLIRQVLRSGIQVTSSTTQIAAGSKQLEATVNEQVSATNQVVATAREISSTAQDLTRTMTDVSEMAEEMRKAAEAGLNSLQIMESSMNLMDDASKSVSARLGAINDRAGNISAVVTTITKVADQTNLLSLNAAIEAEKAGQYGQGFAVVAREIRRLADQTEVATLDIEKMVKDMKTAVSAGVMSMDKFTEQVRQAVTKVSDVSVQLAGITVQVQGVTERFQTVREGMQAQSEGAQQISQSMTQLSETTHQTADALRETNRSLAQLDEAARGLQGAFSRFHVSGAG